MITRQSNCDQKGADLIKQNLDVIEEGSNPNGEEDESKLRDKTDDGEASKKKKSKRSKSKHKSKERKVSKERDRSLK